MRWRFGGSAAKDAETWTGITAQAAFFEFAASTLPHRFVHSGEIGPLTTWRTHVYVQRPRHTVKYSHHLITLPGKQNAKARLTRSMTARGTKRPKIFVAM